MTTQENNKSIRKYSIRSHAHKQHSRLTLTVVDFSGRKQKIVFNEHCDNTPRIMTDSKIEQIVNFLHNFLNQDMYHGR